MSCLDAVLSRPDRVFRLAGVFACAGMAVKTSVAHLYGVAALDDPGLFDVLRRAAGLPATSTAMIGVELLAHATLAAALWRSLGDRRFYAPAAERVALLGVQSAVGLLSGVPLLFFVASGACFVLPARAAFAWVLAQAVAGLAILVAVPLAVPPAAPPAGGAVAVPGSAFVVVGAVLYLVILAFSYCLGMLGATEERTRRELARVNAELEATRELHAESARVAERLRLSRELHDAVGHHLAALSVNLQLAGRAGAGDMVGLIRDSHEIAQTALGDVRDVVGTLRRGASVDLRRALATLAAGVRHPAVHVSVSEGAAAAGPLAAHALFRCAQEIITNAMRHSGARNLWLTLSSDDRGLTLRARDDGWGAAAFAPGNGLRGMRERVEECGGELRVGPRKGGGFAVAVRLPLGEGHR